MAGIPQKSSVIGGELSFQDSTALAAYDVSGTALGTTAYNVAVAGTFKLVLSSAAPVTDQILAVSGVSGARWVLQQAATGAVGWFESLKSTFQSQTGLAAVSWSPILELDFANSGLTASQQGFQSSGTGAGFVYTNLPGGVIKATGPTSGSGYADWASAPQGQIPYYILGNLRSKRFMAAYRLAIGKTPSAPSLVSVGVFNGVFAGLGYAGAATNWQYVRGATPANISDTGKAISVDASGATGYLTMYVANFDNTNLSYCVDVVGGASIVTAEALTNLTNAAGYPYLYNEGAAAGDIYFLDKVLVCAEL